MNATNSKPKWVRLIIAIGILCAVVAYCSFFVSCVFWNKNGSDARLFDRAVGPLVLVTLLGIFVCGISLLKHRKTIGRILIALGIGFLILGILFPEL
jgi:hypothetical protein